MRLSIQGKRYTTKDLAKKRKKAKKEEKKAKKG
jgi:hypothetical protein